MEMSAEKALEVGAGLVICDTLSDWTALSGDSENNAGAALEVMRPLQDAAAEGPAILVCMHERKSGGDTVDAARGSSAFGGAAEIIFSLHRVAVPGHESRRELTGVGRFDDIPTRLVVEMVDGHYVSLGSSGDVERKTARRLCVESLAMKREWAKPLAHLEAKGKGVVSRVTFQRVLDQLINEGIVLREYGAGEASNKAYGYWLARAG